MLLYAIAIGVLNAMSSNSTTNDVNAPAEPVESSLSRNRDRTEKLRVVTGLFEESASLTAALEELLSRGFSVENICVSGTHDSLSMAGSMIQKKQRSDTQLMRLFVHTEFFDTQEAPQTVVGSQGKLFTQLSDLIKKHRTDTSGTVGDECSQLTAQFFSQIEKGQLVLIVGTDQPRQLIHASKVFLKYSSDAIQTHEFRRGPKC